MACNLKCESVSLPAISSGRFRFPRKLCVRHFFRAAEDFAFENKPDDVTLRRIRYTNFDWPTVEDFYEEFNWRYTLRSKCYPKTGTDNLGLLKHDK